MKLSLKKILPIYVNTLNVFTAWRTWWLNRHTHRIPRLDISLVKRPFDWIEENVYTWYWWDHLQEWRLDKKLILILIDDVQYKWTFDIRQLESMPFILIRIFNWNLIVKLEAPKRQNDFDYYESMDNLPEECDL